MAALSPGVRFLYADEDGDDLIRMHILPRDDLIEHEESEDCVCGPDVEFREGGAIIAHHALDRREQHEPH